MTRTIVGLDIGGANLKAVTVRDTEVVSVSRPFPLWRSPERLAEALSELLQLLPPADTFAVTMTGELCDCFATKRDGVLHILNAVDRITSKKSLFIWTTEGRFLSLQQARATPLLAAAANWLALATWAGRLAPQGTALLLDIGSTTSDLIPLVTGVPRPEGRTDPDRLRSHELVYTGVRRTPITALLPTVAAELFATSLDAYLLLGGVPENELDLDTADGRPATIADAHARIARMICADLETSTATQRLGLAADVRAAQQALLDDAVTIIHNRLPQPFETMILSGSGEFLGHHVLERRTEKTWRHVHSLTNLLGPATSTAACAYAVAVLCQEREASS